MVLRMPRSIGIRCGVKMTETGLPAMSERPCSISGVWRWLPTEPATVAWVEALDGGDPKATVPHRDKVMTLAAPFSAAPVEIARTEFRAAQPAWTDAGVLMLTENDRKKAMRGG